MIAFSSQRLERIRQRGAGQISATLVLPSEHMQIDKVRSLHRESPKRPKVVEMPTRAQSVIVWLDDWDRWIDRGRRRPVNNVLPDGTLCQARITILLVELVDVYAEQIADPKVRILTQKAAQACAFRSIFELREWWKKEHSRSPLAQIVWFSMGDTRDEDRYLRRYVSRGGPDGHGDYSSYRAEDVIDLLPALTEAQYRELAANAKQQHIGRKVVQEKLLSEQTLAERVARIHAVGEALRASIYPELRDLAKSIAPEEKIMRDRGERGLRKIG